MAVKTTTTYGCDGCGKTTKAASDLRRFVLVERTIGSNAVTVAEAKTDLCTDCERKLHEKALPLWPEKEAEHMAGIVRG
jgi:hypothetical protein